MKKKLLISVIILTAIISIFFLASCTGKKHAQIVKNSGMEEYNSKAVKNPEWEKIGEAGEISIEYVDTQSANYDKKIGNHYVKFLNSSAGAIKYLQKVKLQRGVTYKLSFDIKIENDIQPEDKDKKVIGLYLGFDNDSTFNKLQFTKKTEGKDGIEWQTKTAYIKYYSRDEAKLVVGMGHNSEGKAKGTAFVDNIKIEKAKNIPKGAEISKVGIDGSKYLNNKRSGLYVASMFFISLIILSLGFVLFNKFKKNDNIKPNEFNGMSIENTPTGTSKVRAKLSSPAFGLFLILVAGFIIRFLIIALQNVFNPNISHINLVTSKLASVNPTGIYEATNTSTPFGLMYILWAIGGFSQAVGVTRFDTGMNMLIRLPSLIAELLTIFLIFYSASKYIGEKKGLVICAIYALLPVFFLVSSLYTLFAPISIFFFMLMFKLMLEKKYVGSIVVFFISWSLEYYTLVLMPILIVYLIYAFIQDKEKRLDIIASFTISILVFLLLALPFDYSFIAKGNIVHVFSNMVGAFKQTPALATNSFSLYSIFGFINVNANVTLIVLSFMFYIAIISYIAYVYYLKHNRLDLIGLSAFLFIAISILSAKSTILTLVIGLGLLLFYTMIVKDYRLYLSFALLSITGALNISQHVSISGYITGNINAKNVSFIYNDPFVILFSIISVLTVIYLAFTLFTITKNDVVYELDSVKSIFIGIKNNIIERKNNKKKEKFIEATIDVDKKTKTSSDVERENLGVTTRADYRKRKDSK